METIKTNLRNHMLLYILLPTIIVVVFISYDRFMVKNDYMIRYEGTCDTVTEECFVGCEDDECTEEYYYSKVQKYAPDLYRECGEDITDCDNANVCLPDDRNCSVIYCDKEIDGEDCETFTKELNEQDDTYTQSTEKESLRNDNVNNTNI